VSRWLRALLLGALLAATGGAWAIDTEKPLPDPVLQARYESITRELRCLVCQNEAIADSNATLARDLRREVRAMIVDGKTDDEIRDFMIARYGDFVLYKPRMTPINFLLWAAPVLLLAGGLFATLRVVRRRAAEAGVEPEGPEGGAS
jgi:cytochrome c-type biogenesis protein CcmH